MGGYNRELTVLRSGSREGGSGSGSREGEMGETEDMAKGGNTAGLAGDFSARPQPGGLPRHVS